MASAHALHLPSIVVQVFKVLTSSEKICKNTEKLLPKGKMSPKSSRQFLGGSLAQEPFQKVSGAEEEFPCAKSLKGDQKISVSHGKMQEGS